MTVTPRTFEPLTENRFRDIIEAYGADARRWPQDEREAVLAFIHDHAGVAQALLDEARALDLWLDAGAPEAHVLPEESLDAHARAVAAFVDMGVADTVVLMPVKVRSRPMPVIWATGIGIAACIAGALFGVSMSMQSLGDVRAQSVLEQVALVDEN